MFKEFHLQTRVVTQDIASLHNRCEIPERKFRQI